MADAVPVRGNILGRLVPARYILAVLGSIGMAIIYGLKVNLSVAMVAMLNHTHIASVSASSHHGPQNHSAMDLADDETCKSSESMELMKDGPFTWDQTIQGYILSCYFWGYFVSQMPGARVAELFSAKWVMLFSVAINVICTLLTPPMAIIHWAALLAMRIGEGIGGGVTFPAMHVMLASWAPPDERSVMSAIVYAGTALGTVISMFLAGQLASGLGWESVFYVMGGLSCIWMVIWAFLVQDSPNKQSLISQEERDLITSQLGTGNKEEKKPPVPWGKVFTSGPFLAILIAHTCSNWGWYMLLIETPFYLKQVVKISIKEIATYTSLAFFTLWLFSLGISKTLDTLKGKGKITTTWARKVGTLFASVVPAVCLLGLCYIGCNTAGAITLMIIGITCVGGMFCGFLSNHIDIAPNYAGTLMAITNTVATIPGIIVPLVVGMITHDTPPSEIPGAWRLIFFVTVALYIIEIIFYTLLGSGEEQPWNKSHAINDDNINEKGEHTEATPLKVRNQK